MSSPRATHRSTTRSSRRDVLRVGLLGGLGMTLSDLLRARAATGAAQQPREDTSIVWLWMQGGAPHIETFDPKPGAPSEYRSMVGAVPTSLTGVEFGGLLPQLAQSAHRMAVIRSFGHTNGDHLGASHYMLTARDGAGGSRVQTSPSFGSMAAKVRGVSHPVTGMPTFVRLSRTISFDFDQPLWLGAANAPFDGTGQTLNNLSLAVETDRLADRRRLLRGIDQLRRDVDQSGLMDGLDAFEQQAMGVVLGDSKQAFDLTEEPDATRQRYGPGLGEQLLTARRLCEAGCGFVSLNYSYAPKSSDTPFGWDMHLGPSQAGAPPMTSQLHAAFPMFDRAVSAFIEDVAERGLDRNILLIVTGDFGRTPLINEYGGRDHWPAISTLAMAGGGLQMGQVVGTSSPKAEYPTSDLVGPENLLATMLHVLGIPADTKFTDFAGRPKYLVPEQAPPIAALI